MVFSLERIGQRDGGLTYNVQLLFLHALALVYLRKMCAEIFCYVLVPVFAFPVRSDAVAMGISEGINDSGN
jgi:hypothetical protein